MKKGVGISLTQNMLDELDKLARERRMSVSALVQDILHKALRAADAPISDIEAETVEVLVARAQQLYLTLEKAAEKMRQNTQELVAEQEAK